LSFLVFFVCLSFSSSSSSQITGSLEQQMYSSLEQQMYSSLEQQMYGSLEQQITGSLEQQILITDALGTSAGSADAVSIINLSRD